jgi:hypothetical protein
MREGLAWLWAWTRQEGANDALAHARFRRRLQQSMPARLPLL